jgi:hypothetical protein
MDKNKYDLKIFNPILKMNKHFQICFYSGSLSISFLSGKIMFRGVHYVTIDYMVYVQDGWITFSYWKPQFVKESSKESQNEPSLKSSSMYILKLSVEFLRI